MQQAEALVGDSIHRHPYDADIDLILPTVPERAGKVLSFDAEGRPQAVIPDIAGGVARFAMIYQGAHGSDAAPTQRLDGLPLQAGDLYFDTTQSALMAHDGHGWGVTTAPEEAYLSRNGAQAMTGTLDMGGQSIINVSAIDGRDLAADGMALANLQTGMAGLNGMIRSARDATILNAWEIARINGLNSHAMVNTYIDTFIDLDGILAESSHGFHHAPDLDALRNSLDETTLSDATAWTGSGTFSHSGATVTNGGSNGAIRTVLPISGDFDFQFTMAGITNDRTWRMGIFPASEVANFQASDQLGGLPTGYGGSMAGSIGNGVCFLAYGAYVDTINVMDSVVHDRLRSSTGAANGEVFRLSRRGSHFQAWRDDVLFDTFAFTSDEDVHLVLGSDTLPEEYASVIWTIHSGPLAGQVECAPITSDAPPTELRVLADIESTDAPQVDTDIVIAASRDGGNSWTAGTIANLAAPMLDRAIYGTTIDVSGQPAGTEIRVRLTVQDTVAVMLHRWAVQADRPLSIQQP